jgi:hypothetical protein
MVTILLGHRGEGLLTSGQRSACAKLLRAITELVARQSEESDFWTYDGLATHPDWARLRLVAREALLALERGPMCDDRP